jgi:putative tryptophan/tyrosine transport system substrate-binding protein
MRRRAFIAGLGSGALWPLVARAQQSQRLRRVGVLMNVVQGDSSGPMEVAALRQGLMELGWIEGHNIDVEFRWPGGDIERVNVFAKELVRLRPDVLVGRSTPGIAALKQETGTIPIIFVNVTEPVEQGFVQSLARPGGNVTGFTNFEASIGGKWLQLLKEVDRRIARVAVIYNPHTAPFAELILRSVQSAGRTFAVEVVAMPVLSDAEIEAEFAMFARERSGGLIAMPDSFTMQHRDLIIALAARHRIPVVYTNLVSTPMGGLMAFAVDTRDLMQRAATYVDRILKGANPGDLPIQSPVRFQLSINLKAARAIGLDLAPTLIAQADEVIE